MSSRRSHPSVDRSEFAGFRFPPEVIAVAVPWYLRFGLSYRDVEELLAERGIEVDHVTVQAVLVEYLDHYNAHRPHRSLDQRAPLHDGSLGAPIRPPDIHGLARRDRLGGLIHEYQLAA